MWIIIMFDMPTDTKTDKKKHAAFLKNLLADDFCELIPTVYVRNCASEKSAETHWEHVKELLPDRHSPNDVTVKIVSVTDEQFANIQTHQQHRPSGGGFGIGGW